MISIVIPNYNGEALLKNNLPKVFSSLEGYISEVIVVDDASTDASVEEIKNYIEENKNKQACSLVLLENNKNLGFSSTVNKGVKAAKGEIVVLLNTDVGPEKNFLESLVLHFKDPQIFGIGCLDKSYEKGKIVERGRGVGKWSRGFLAHSRGEVDKKNTLWVSGGSGAFRKSIWEKLGGLNELYNPFYWEDIDLSYRALKSGYKVLFEKKSIVNHEHEKGTIKRTYSKFKIKTTAYRNQFIFVWENATDLSLQFSHVLFLPYHFARALINSDWAFFVGFIKAFILLPKIIQSSFKYQKFFVKSDKAVIQNFMK